MLGRYRRRRRRADRHGRPGLHLADRQHRGRGTHSTTRRSPKDRRNRSGSTSTSGSRSKESAEGIARGIGEENHVEFGRGESLEEEPTPTSAAVSPTTKASATPAAAARARRVAAPTPPAAAPSRSPGDGDGGAQFEPGGAPTLANPTTTIAPFGPAPIGVPNFVINSFEIPPFLLPIYQACGTEYGIPWEVLAAINKIETGFGTNLNVSSAGAVGWMQFLPSSWEASGLDANGDGAQGPVQPGRRDLRRRPLPQGRGRPEGSLRRDPRLQPRRLVRAGGAHLRPRLRSHPLHPGRLADRAHRGRPLPDRRRRPLLGRTRRPRGA